MEGLAIADVEDEEEGTGAAGEKGEDCYGDS